jgi:hypothetical protein
MMIPVEYDVWERVRKWVGWYNVFDVEKRFRVWHLKKATRYRDQGHYQDATANGYHVMTW